MATKKPPITEIILTLGILILAFLSIKPILMEPMVQKEAPQIGGNQASTATAEDAAEKTSSPRELLRYFTAPRPFVPEPPPEEKAEEEPVGPVQADWLQSLGSITDESGLQWLYFKNKRSTGLIKVRLDGKEEAGRSLVSLDDDQYIIKIDDAVYSVRRSGR